MCAQSKADSTRAGIASALRHVAARDRVMSHKSRMRSVEWYDGYMWCLEQIGDLRHSKEFCGALLPLVEGLYSCNKTGARALIKDAKGCL